MKGVRRNTMVNSKFYTTEEIEQLKLRILAYRNLLYTLKTSTSMEDYLQIKDEFEEMKKKISEMDFLQDHVEDVQLTQPVEHNNQVEQFTLQLTSLNQMVEEVIAVLTTLIPGPEKKESNDEVTFMDKMKAELERPNESTPTKKQAAVINQPSYRQLKKLANEVSHLETIEESKEPLEENNYIPRQQSHFNTAFFQSLNKQTNNSYTGLHKNMPLKNKAHLKSASETPDYKKTTIAHEKDHQLPHLATSEFDSELPPSSITNKPKNRPVNIVHTVEEPIIEQQPRPIIAAEQTDAATVEEKKQKSNSFFDFFRK